MSDIFQLFPSPWKVYREDSGDRVCIVAANGRRVLEVSPGQHFMEPLPTIPMMEAIAAAVVRSINETNPPLTSNIKQCIATGHPCGADTVNEPDTCPGGGFCRWRSRPFDPVTYERLRRNATSPFLQDLIRERWDKVCAPRGDAPKIGLNPDLDYGWKAPAEPSEGDRAWLRTVAVYGETLKEKGCCGDAKPGGNRLTRADPGYIYHVSHMTAEEAIAAEFDTTELRARGRRVVCGEQDDGA